MGLEALLNKLERRNVMPVTAGVLGSVTTGPASVLNCTAVTLVTAENFSFDSEESMASLQGLLDQISDPHVDAPMQIEDNERRYCAQCENLAASGVCLAARRREIVALPTYEPIQDLPQRCEAYLPDDEDWDRRPGWVRWPGLVRTEKLRKKQEEIGLMSRLEKRAQMTLEGNQPRNLQPPDYIPEDQ